jgi:hypothetical protein
MKPQVVVNAYVERIEGNLAIISVGKDRSRPMPRQITFPGQEKKYMILLRKFMPAAAREGLSLEISLNREGIQRASPDLEKTIKDARLFNEVINYMRQMAVEEQG